MITIIPPKVFDFNKTIRMLQRSEHDPINIVSNNSWSRIFRFPNHIVLIQTTYNKKIESKILYGELDKNIHQILIQESLGLDDPILNHKVFDIPHPEKISNVIGLTVPGYPDVFEAIIQIIMGQQVSVLVANKMRTNFTNKFGGQIIHQNNIYKHFPHPHVILNESIETLRSLGLSHTKSKSVLEVAKTFLENSEVQQLNRLSQSDHIRKLLTQIHGVGDWTVDWLLLRGFRRFEIIPSTDLAVRKAFTWWLNKKTLMSMDAVKKYERKLFPYGGAIAYRVLCAYSEVQTRKGDV